MWFDTTTGSYVISNLLGGNIDPGDNWWICNSPGSPLDDYIAQGTASGDMTETHTPDATPTITHVTA